MEIHCDPANLASAAIPRKLGYTHEATLRRRTHSSDGKVEDSMIWTLFAGLPSKPRSPTRNPSLRCCWEGNLHLNGRGVPLPAKRWRMIEIAFLVDCPEVISTLTQWFRAQWPEYYAGRTLADIAQEFFSEANRDGLPVRLLAFADGDLAGTVTLRDQALQALPEYHPGLGGLLVLERHRGRGIGTKLVRAGMNLAREQGYERVYATTVTASGILERLDWKLVQAVSHRDEQLLLYRCELRTPIQLNFPDKTFRQHKFSAE